MPTAIEVKVKFRAGHRLLPPYVGNVITFMEKATLSYLELSAQS